MSRKNKQKSHGPTADRGLNPDSNSAATTALMAKPEHGTEQGLKGPEMGQPSKRKQEKTWLEAVWVRSSRWLGSLQIAVVLLSLFAFVLAIGTIVESWYSDKVAKDLVYRTWWFNLLLFFLGINIFFAAAKKWPWKKHQTGFLITHLGLITMVAGGLLTGLFGTDTTLALLASSDPHMQRSEGLPQADHWVIDRETATIRVREIKDGKEHTHEFPIQPGSVAWRADEYFQPNLHPLVAVLGWLEHPLPRFWSQTIDGNTSIEVLNYYPHVRREKFRPASDSEVHADSAASVFPAVKIYLSSSLPMMKQMDPEIWVAGSIRDSSHPLMGIGAVEMLGRCPAELADEFLQSPPAGEEKGQLVLRLGGVTQRVSVAQSLGQPPQAIGSTGWKVKIDRFESELPQDAVHSRSRSSGPVLAFTLVDPSGHSTRCGLLARLPGQFIPIERSAGNLPAVSVWYHPADPRMDQQTRRSLLQFAVVDQAGASQLFYRSFSSGSGKFQFDKAGAVNTDGTDYPIWAATANWKFHVMEFLPAATDETWFIPEDRRPGLEDFAKLRPAVRCRLHAGSQSKDFWVVRDPPYLMNPEVNMEVVSVGGRRFFVNFADNKSDLGFEIKLLRAETLYDPGTKRDAGYTSWVQVSDSSQNIKEDRIITMNEPLDYRGYKFYQSGLNPVGADDATLKPISNSIFTVSRDPGLWMKYLGSTMLALGIVCMFYMKAYFFKPRGRQAAAANS